MKASVQDQKALLELQETDLVISRLHHQIDAHPLREKLAELAGRADDLKRSAIGQKVELSDLQRSMTGLEDRIAKTEARRKLQQDRLESGKVGVRDMRAVEAEIARITAHRDDLEGELLEQMADYEQREKFLAKTEDTSVALAEDDKKTKQQMEDALAEQVAELTKAQEKSERLRGSISASVLEEYDHLQGRIGTLVVLTLEDGRLVNAPVTLSGTEVASIEKLPVDQIWFSDETGYLIVRAPK